mmetsp:Transcript_87931/g.250747  ORF Transcript_87931/g.250747 Transcript_87931/m.250747 type:complete len:84 (+) Transcript_87931:91-342(+)
MPAYEVSPETPHERNVRREREAHEKKVRKAARMKEQNARNAPRAERLRKRNGNKRPILECNFSDGEQDEGYGPGDYDIGDIEG